MPRILPAARAQEETELADEKYTTGSGHLHLRPILSLEIRLGSPPAMSFETCAAGPEALSVQNRAFELGQNGIPVNFLHGPFWPVRA